MNKKQKIDLLYFLDVYQNIYRLGDLPNGVFEQLEKINDTEILWSETNRYLNDNYMRELYKNNITIGVS